MINSYAAHTDAPPGRYDYTAKVAAAGRAASAAQASDTAPEEALALADRTYAYVAKALGAAALADEKEELEADRKWLGEAKTARERKTVEKEIRRLRRRILFRHPDLQFEKLIAVQRGIPYSRENHMVDQYLGRWSRPGPGLLVLENWRSAPKKTSLLGDRLPAGMVINPGVALQRHPPRAAEEQCAVGDAGGATHCSDAALGVGVRSRGGGGPPCSAIRRERRRNNVL